MPKRILIKRIMACSSCRDKTVPEKLKSILDGWKYLVWKDPNIERVAKERAKICAECNHNKNTMCKQCGCYIPAKIRSMQEKCPIAKWD